MKKLIILYGNFNEEKASKQQRMIDGTVSCGYRSYAEKFGCIVYMSTQVVSKNWEHVITNPKDVVQFCNSRPDHVVWSVKHDELKDNNVLSKINNYKLYYSCNNKNMYNKYCNHSLVDTEERAKLIKNSLLYVKGKNEDFWKPVNKHKEYDYLLMGQRGDKNEIFFLNELNKISDKRKVLWIGGYNFKDKVKTKHSVEYTKLYTQEQVRDNISKSKIGILFTSHPDEGFPQSFIEMTMCGVPVVYNKKGPFNQFYFNKYNSIITDENKLIFDSEKLLKTFDSTKCREHTIVNCSLQQSYERMIKYAQ